MPASSTPSAPQNGNEPVEVDLLHDHGERWQIERLEGGKWLAIERPQVRPLARFYLASSAADLPRPARQRSHAAALVGIESD
jgi:hypothetical protein